MARLQEQNHDLQARMGALEEAIGIEVTKVSFYIPASAFRSGVVPGAPLSLAVICS
jgi:hypothetical protein